MRQRAHRFAQANIGYQNLTAEPAQNRVVLLVRDPAQTPAALTALQELVTESAAPGAPAEVALDSTPDGQVTITLSAAALKQRASGAVQQSIEIVRRRIDETGVADPQITRQGDARIVVQLPGIRIRTGSRNCSARPRT